MAQVGTGKYIYVGLTTNHNVDKYVLKEAA